MYACVCTQRVFLMDCMGISETIEYTRKQSEELLSVFLWKQFLAKSIFETKIFDQFYSLLWTTHTWPKIDHAKTILTKIDCMVPRTVFLYLLCFLNSPYCSIKKNTSYTYVCIVCYYMCVSLLPRAV